MCAIRLAKRWSPTIQKNIASLKKLESQHQRWDFRTANQLLVRALDMKAGWSKILDSVF